MVKIEVVIEAGVGGIEFSILPIDTSKAHVVEQICVTIVWKQLEQTFRILSQEILKMENSPFQQVLEVRNPSEEFQKKLRSRLYGKPDENDNQS